MKIEPSNKSGNGVKLLKCYKKEYLIAGEAVSNADKGTNLSI